MTGESKKLTEPWIAQHGVRYGYAYDKGEKLFRELGFSGYPSAALIDPKGTVAWIGHPAELTDAMIEQHLVGAVTVGVDVAALVARLPASAQSLKEPLSRGQLGKAIAAARSLSGRDAEVEKILAELEAIAAKQLAQVTARRADGDCLGAVETAKELEKLLAGTPQAQEAAALGKAITNDKVAAAILRDQKTLESIPARAAKAKKPKDLNALRTEVDQLRKKHPDSFVARRGQEILDMIEARRAELR